jgi:hypothetical protein
MAVYFLTQISRISRREAVGQSCCCLRCNSWSMVCLHAPGSHPPAQAAEAEAPEAEGRGGKPSDTQKFAKFSEGVDGGPKQGYFRNVN